MYSIVILKVEMFVLTEGSFSISDMMLNEINQIQVELFSNLGLHFKYAGKDFEYSLTGCFIYLKKKFPIERVLDMPSEELGMPAYRKYDIESWQPAHKRYGEISSTSNCGDFQSRRLNIKYKEDSSDSKLFVHTLNGTACAVPRLLTCIVETNWDTKNNVVHLPKPLQKYMDDRQVLKIPKTIRKAHNLSFKDRNHEA
jgi:seryl-tRNA synthetase